MKKEDLKKVRDIIKTPRGKALVFFGFYFIFFIVIGAVFRSGEGSTIADNEKNSTFDFSLESITNNNYKFTYNILVDGTSTSYTGIRYDAKEKVKSNNLVDFYGENGNYFTDTSGVWIKTETPYLYSEFYDGDNISSLISSASYVSKTEYDSGKKVYNFSISSTTINKLFENIDLDVFEIPNEIIVSVDEDGYVNQIKFKLDSYCKIKNICTNNMIIELSYEEYGKIEEIVSPLDQE